MMLTRTRLITMIGALATSATLLAGCGGTTVTSDDVEATGETSVAPLDRSATSSTSPASSEASEDKDKDKDTGTGRSSEPSESAGVAAPAPPAPQDRGAREISEIPEQQPAHSREDESFLTAVAEEGINVEGVESQLIGAARTVCAEESGPVSDATALAVAGQLTAQDRTDLPAEDVSEILENAARESYCP